VANKLKQAAVLVLPTETAHPGLAGRFQYGAFNGLAVNSSLAEFGLFRGDRLQRGVVDGLDKAVSESIERRAQCQDIFGDRYVLLRLGNDGAVVNDGAPGDAVGAIVDQHGGIDKIAVCVGVTHTQLGELARAATHRVLVAFGARSSVVD